MSDISVIIPVYNGEKWIDHCMSSIAAAQSVLLNHFPPLTLEIVVYNDGSNDNTRTKLETWAKYFCAKNVAYKTTNADTSRGVGAAKNGAVANSSGRFLCFQDIDDIMHQDRLILQWRVASCNHNTLVGSKVIRNPPNSTPRFIKWANNLTPTELKSQIYTSNGPTLLMPTWFCHRSVYLNVGGFDESGCGTPEDLLFFYEHIDRGGELYRVDEELVTYTYHEGATTFSVTRECIWHIQLERLEKCVLSQWSKFTIWNAGKLGRKVVRALCPKNLAKVTAFCDVDVNKIGRTIELYCPVKRAVLAKVPVIHYTEAKSPLVICVKQDLTNGDFEKNLASLNLIEGVDYVLFC